MKTRKSVSSKTIPRTANIASGCAVGLADFGGAASPVLEKMLRLFRTEKLFGSTAVGSMGLGRAGGLMDANICAGRVAGGGIATDPSSSPAPAAAKAIATAVKRIANTAFRPVARICVGQTITVPSLKNENQVEAVVIRDPKLSLS